jgi:hypothetical protein
VRASAKTHVLAGQAGELGDAQAGLDRGEQQRVVSTAGPGAWVRSGDQRGCFFESEVVDQRAVESFCRDREHPFDHLGVFGVTEGGVSVERVHRRQADVAGPGAVMALVLEVVQERDDHPSQRTCAPVPS